MELHTKYAHYTDATIRLGQYGNGTLAVQIEDGEGREGLTINLEAYGLIPDEPDMFYVKDYAEHEGLPNALVEAGIAVKVLDAAIPYGPFDAHAYLMRLTPEYAEVMS